MATMPYPFLNIVLPIMDARASARSRMEMEIGKKYDFRVAVQGLSPSFYTGTVLEISDPLITIRDKFGKSVILNTKNIVSAIEHD